MQGQRETVCQLDCFHCPYSDCVQEKPMTAAEYAEAAQRERMIKDEMRSARERRIAAKQAAYYDAHREEIAAKQAAYYDAHREEFGAIGASVRALRRGLNLSQTELGRHFGVGQRAVSYWERGEVPFDHEAVLRWLHAESRKGVEV